MSCPIAVAPPPAAPVQPLCQEDYELSVDHAQHLRAQARLTPLERAAATPLVLTGAAPPDRTAIWLHAQYWGHAVTATPTSLRCQNTAVGLDAVWERMWWTERTTYDWGTTNDTCMLVDENYTGTAMDTLQTKYTDATATVVQTIKLRAQYDTAQRLWTWARDFASPETREYTVPNIQQLTDIQRAAIAQNEAVWHVWNGAYMEPKVLAAMSEDERRAWEREKAERAQKTEEAKQRARALWESWLSPEQRKQFAQSGCIIVKSKQSGRRYQINANERAGRHGNIVELDAHDLHVATLCCAPRGDIPHFDAMLGQKLALELDEHDFRRTANFTPLVHGYERGVA